MEEIKKILLDYRDYTINIIDLLEKDDLDSLQSQIEKRQNSLNRLISFTEEREEAKRIYEELQIRKFQMRVEELIRIKSYDIKKKLGDISRNKKATSAYGKIGSGAAIFSKKI